MSDREQAAPEVKPRPPRGRKISDTERLLIGGFFALGSVALAITRVIPDTLIPWLVCGSLLFYDAGFWDYPKGVFEASNRLGHQYCPYSIRWMLNVGISVTTDDRNSAAVSRAEN